MKRKTTILDQQELMNQMKALFNLTQTELNDIVNQAKRFDTKGTGYVQRNEVDDIMRDLKLMDDQLMVAKFKEEILQYDTKMFDLKQICDLYCKLKNYQLQIEEQDTVTQEYIDAFVALGGQSDKSGQVSRQYIMDIIQKEFELNLDVKSFLGEFEGDQMTFEDFCQLFENAGDDAKSFITSMSQAVRSQNDFQVRYKDFLKWDKAQA